MNDAFILSKPSRLAPPEPGPQTLSILCGGAGRGAEKSLEAIAVFNGRSRRYRIVPTYADPSPGRVSDLLDSAKSRNVEAFGVEARIEEAVRADEAPATPVVLQIDRSADITQAVRAIRGTARTVLVYLLMKRPGGDLWGLRMYLDATRPEDFALAADFFERLAEVTLPGGSMALFGEGADAGDIAREPLFRGWFAEHLTKNLPKAVAKLDPECAPFEVTTDGRTTSTLHLVAHDAFQDPVDLAEAVVRNPGSPIRKGRDFTIAEFTPAGVRFSTVRIRKTDGKLALKGSVVLDKAARDEAQRLVDARLREQEAARPAGAAPAAGDSMNNRPDVAAIAPLASALAAAVTTTLTATNPVQTTD